MKDNSWDNNSDKSPSYWKKNNDIKEVIDKEKIKVFFIKITPTSLLSTESYLRNRKWKVRSAPNLRDALLQILKDLPHILFVPADHPNKKLKILPKLLKQTFPIHIVAYSESQSPSSVAMIHELGAEHTLFPPTTGPSVERLLFKIQNNWDESQFDYSKTHISSAKLQNLTTLLESRPAPETVQKPFFGIEEMQNVMKNILDEDLKKISSAVKNSIMSEGADQALNSTADNVKTKPLIKINRVSNAACIVVDSERFKGYLICAFGSDQKVDPEFLTFVKKKLFSFLQAHGETAKEEDSLLKIQIQEVDFEPWTLEQADFLVKSIHKGSEVAMAFFPQDPAQLNFEKSNQETMFQLKIDDIEEGVVQFDLYLYLPTNQKYLLYTPQGKTFFPEQKKRLQDRGIQTLHLKKESLKDVKRYRAEKFLNNRISAFKKSLGQTEKWLQK